MASLKRCIEYSKWNLGEESTSTEGFSAARKLILKSLGGTYWDENYAFDYD